jgi:hypothetical protein
MKGHDEIWIASNAADAALWHLATEIVVRGLRSGKVFRRYLVAKCNGQQLGGVYGQTVHSGRPVGARLCTRCSKYARGQISNERLYSMLKRSRD